jgi:1-acyl-sn-glycerol-3-phosphate acyltransferase
MTARAFYFDTRIGRRPQKARAWLLAVAAGLTISAASLILVGVGVLTLFRARRLYAGIACGLSRAVLRMYGIRLRVHQDRPFASTQTVYVSNHSSSLDLFVLAALGLPLTRFFLSGFLRRIPPLGIISSMMGAFFTVSQDRPEERRRIFARAEGVLRRTGESVYLSPEGGRITGGRLGPFNKGAFHLATSLRAPIVPLYIHIPEHVDPGRGLDARPGTVRVYVLPPIDTRDWRLDDLGANKERVRSDLVRFQDQLRCA